VEWAIGAGDFGIWPDPSRIDRGTRKHNGPGDFANLYLQGFSAPIQTLIVPGIHEDHKWLKHRWDARNLEILGNVHILTNGYHTSIGDLTTNIHVVGIGKTFSPISYNDRYKKKAYKHYAKNDIKRAAAAQKADILIMYDGSQHLDQINLVSKLQPELFICTRKNHHSSIKLIEQEVVIEPGKVIYINLPNKNSENKESYNRGIVNFSREELNK